MRRGIPKPLLTISGPVKAKVYRAAFHPLRTTKYLDVQALQKAKKDVIEVGEIKAPGMSVRVAAEIQRGKLTSLRPVRCEGCQPGRGARRIRKAVLRRCLREASAKIRALKLPTLTLPVPLKISPRRGLIIEIGSIIIIVGPPPTNDCIYVEIVGVGWCWACEDLPLQCFPE